MISIQLEAYFYDAVCISSREIAGIARKITSGLGIDDPAMDILITHDGTMKKLNKRFLGMEGPTNILSFPDPDDHTDSLGQLVINADALGRESFLYGQEPVSCLERLMIHGILHLAGYEHGELMDEAALGLESVINQ